MDRFEIGGKVRLTGNQWNSNGLDTTLPYTIIGVGVDGIPEISDSRGDAWYVIPDDPEWGGEPWINDCGLETEDGADDVNHPSHYTAYNGVEVIQLTEQMNFCRGNAVKYIARAGLKDPDKEIEDLRKAIWYIEREIKRMEGE